MTRLASFVPALAFAALLVTACDDTDLAPLPGARTDDGTAGSNASEGGSSANAGTTAHAGTSAHAGANGGSAGKGGSGGVVGSMGLGGASGSSGHAGTSGAGGASAHAGASGSSGGSGHAGSSGASGAAGSGGASGSSANAGNGGISGSSGASGSSGIGGASGSNAAGGMSGASGSTSVGGASGTGGSSGASGAAGMSGASGSAGASSCNPVVEEHPIEGATHVAVCSPVTYLTNPPSSGNHYPIWADFKTYDMPVPRGFYVHDLEHGAVVFTYNCPSGCDDQVAAAQAVLDAHQDPLCTTPPPRARVVMTPDPLLDVTFAASAWGWTLRADCFDAQAFSDFLEAHFGQGPEMLCIAGEDPFAEGLVTPGCGM